MDWLDPKTHTLPPQGLKILCFTKGDCYVAQRFRLKTKDYWIPISFADLAFSTDAPELFSYIDFPEGYEGYMKAASPMTGKLLCFDVFAIEHPVEYEEIVRFLLSTYKK
jgi:hypothetical protein